MKFLPALAASLLPDPFYQAITVESPNADHQLKVLQAYLAYSFEEAARTGRVTVAPDALDGAALWLLPQSADVQALESERKGLYLRQLLGARGSENYHSIVDYMSPRAQQHVPPDAWYLSIIGVRPSAQGNGLGVVLLRPTLAEADAAQVVTYLETFSARNLSFYRRLGYQVAAEVAEPITRTTYFIMRRDAQLC